MSPGDMRAAGRDDLAERVRHVAAIEGDGAGYDILSFEASGAVKYIEVKTTTGGPAADFFLSANELAFSRAHADAYCLHRVYGYDATTNRGACYVVQGALDAGFSLTPTQFRASR